MEEFTTPPGHKDFSAKKLFDACGAVHWGALAYIAPNGGGPEGNHTHDDNHMFIVCDGEVQIEVNGTTHTVRKNESFFVDGRLPHSIWNRSDKTAQVVKISLARA